MRSHIVQFSMARRTDYPAQRYTPLPRIKMDSFGSARRMGCAGLTARISKHLLQKMDCRTIQYYMSMAIRRGEYILRHLHMDYIICTRTAFTSFRCLINIKANYPASI